MTHKRKVVYTALTGGYDGLMQHPFVHPDYDYILFSNDFKKERIGHWQVRPICYDSDDKQLQSRYPKLQPHEVLAEYESSLYVDANVALKDDTLFRSIDRLEAEGVKLAGVKHQLRQCLYRESLFLLLSGRISCWDTVRRQMSRYKAEGFQRDYGMFENNIMYRRHNDPDVVRLDIDWWEEFLNNTRRDQLSFAYCMWRNHCQWHYLLPEQYSARNHPAILCPNHQGSDRHGWDRRKNIYPKYILPLVHKLYFPIFWRNL